MPHIKVKTASGSVNFHYTISTPTTPSAKAIDPSLPTAIFLHPVYIAQTIYHPQFSDPQLRRFNLIALDARCHGDTTGTVPPHYRRVEAAEDVFKFMEALRLPPCHMFGVSMGACVALQLAILHPHQVLSLCMVSPLPLEEPSDVGEGRREIYDCWVEGYRDPSNIDQDALLDAVHGALQLGFNDATSSFISSLITLLIPQAMKNWAPDRFEEFYTVSVKFFIDRKRHPRTSLEKVSCPIKLVHCGGDIAYPQEYTEEIRDLFLETGLDVQLVSVPDASHFGSVTHAKEINTIFHDFVVELSNSGLPAAPSKVVSPYEAQLLQVGWVPNEGKQGDSSEEEDDDDDVFEVSLEH